MNLVDVVRLKKLLVKMRDEVIVNRHDLKPGLNELIGVVDIEARGLARARLKKVLGSDARVRVKSSVEERRVGERDPYEHEQHEAAASGLPVLAVKADK